MITKISIEDRRTVRKIIARLGKKRTWSEIADELNLGSASRAYNWFFDRVVEVEGRYIVSDDLPKLLKDKAANA